MLQPKELMNRGYERYKSGYFRISTIQHEHVVVPSSEKIQEYLRAKDDVLNFQDGANDVGLLFHRSGSLSEPDGVKLIFVDRLFRFHGQWGTAWDIALTMSP